MEATCDFPASAKIFGDIVVGPYTVTVPSGVVMGINLSANKMTFTTGKVLYSGTAKSDNSVGNGHMIAVTYNAGTTTSCPAGMQVLSSAAAQSAFVGGLSAVVSSGTMYCAYP